MKFKDIIQIDERKLHSIIQDYHVRLVIYANEYLQDVEKSRDAVSAMFIDLWEKKDRLEFLNEKLLRGYLYEVTRNKAIDLVRKNNQELKALSQYSYLEKTIYYPEEDRALVVAETISVIRKCIQELSPQYRAVMEMLLEGKSHEEIATTLGIAPVTVRSNKNRAIEILKEKMTGHVLLVILIMLEMYTPPLPHLCL